MQQTAGRISGPFLFKGIEREARLASNLRKGCSTIGALSVATDLALEAIIHWRR
jgi:hypothetical protein